MRLVTDHRLLLRLLVLLQGFYSEGFHERSSHKDSKDESHIAEIIFNPTNVSFRPLTAMESVKLVDCSFCHTLVLTSIGTVYSCGDGSDGQLGHGDLSACSILRHIDWFTASGRKSGAADSPISIVQVSAGADTLGSHSAAVDVHGMLYTWGKAALCGHVGFWPSLGETVQVTAKKMPKVRAALPVTCPRQLQCFQVKPTNRLAIEDNLREINLFLNVSNMHFLIALPNEFTRIHRTTKSSK